LDRDTSGLILLTSDERVSKAIFKGIIQQPKTYKVHLDKPITNQDIRILKNGVKITKDTNKYIKILMIIITQEINV
jgi:pseudouridine synthase